tara:strand:+ start:2266 stop:2880 length:615 start_codon:yes stop_codon:yes gene_type:complete
MTKLIGTGPNQVPTNADLGTMAYLDLEHASTENQIVQYLRDSSYAHSIYSLTQNVEQDLPLSLSITPKYANSRIMIRLHWNMSWKDTFSDCGFALRRDVNGSSTGYVQGSVRPDATRGRFTVGSHTRSPVWWIDDGPYDGVFSTISNSVLLMDDYSSTDPLTYTFTAGTGGTSRVLYWNQETHTGNSGTFAGGNCSIEAMEIRQ